MGQLTSSQTKNQTAGVSPCFTHRLVHMCGTHQPAKPYNPSLEDIRHVRFLLQVFLPFELADVILHQAEYYCVISNETDRPQQVQNADHLCASTDALSAEEVKSIVRLSVVIQGHDQGWSSYPEDRGSTRNSWTWYTLQLEGPDGVDVPMERLATNLHAVKETQTYKFEWHRGDDIVKRIQPGQSIAVWAHARYDFLVVAM